MSTRRLTARLGVAMFVATAFSATTVVRPGGVSAAGILPTAPAALPTLPPLATPPIVVPTALPANVLPSQLPTITVRPSALPTPGASSPVSGVIPTSAPLPTGPSGTGSGQPGASATATSLQVDPIGSCVNCSSTSAGDGSGSATATGIRVLGTTLVGSDPGATGSGSLFGLTSNRDVAVAVAGWMAATEATHSGSTSHARASLFDMNVGQGTATVAVLESFSDSSWSPTGSTSSSGANGGHAEVFNGALAVVVLHSQSSSSGQSSVYLVGLNGTFLDAASGGQGARSIAIPAVSSISLLQTSADPAGTGDSSSASIATVADTVPWLIGTGETGVILASSAQSAPASSGQGGTGSGGGGGTGSGGGGGTGSGGGGGGSGGGGGGGAACRGGCGHGGAQGATQGAAQVAAQGTNGIGTIVAALATPLTGAGLRLYAIVLVGGGLVFLAMSRRRRPVLTGPSPLERIA